ncbi:MAG TPA: sugar phosphate nucleotidyltransferase [Gemmatimonadaceae bacterium]|nr:sugar phosphate nucleotidyltransferase [Gemmatimonadaceae bacterium]
MTRWAVILAGGVGSRFWPLSTPQRPKQLLPLVDDQPLLADTVQRLAPLVDAEHTLIITNAIVADAVRTLLPRVPASNIIAEPRSAGTAPALAWAAAEIERRDASDATMVCVHADWAIADPDTFRDTLARAADAAARHASLVTVGVVPTRPDPGFGYIQPGEAVDGARHVARFVEKPDRTTAERMMRDGYLWNSGIFAWRAGDFLDEIRTHTPEVAPALDCAAAGDARRFFSDVRSISVDNGVLERSARVLVVPGDFGWDDVGTWAALRRVRALDADGNAVAGDTHLVASHDNVVHAEGNTVVLYGVSDLVVVTRAGLTLVTTVERAADLKLLLDALPPAVRDIP